jgi:hypothetical protein
MWRPITVPSRTFIAANSVVVPRRSVVRHGSGAHLLQQQSGLRAIERLSLAFLVDQQDDGLRRGSTYSLTTPRNLSNLGSSDASQRISA